MTQVFADTFYFLALVSPRDASHQKAWQFGERNDRPILTTSWILTEVADGLADTKNRRLARQLYMDLHRHATDQVVPPSQELFERGFELYESRPDKDWSLTDCISFVVMQDHGVREALTADRHFEQAGFVALLS